MLKKLPKVALLIESSREFGRGVLSGIAKYIHVHGPWSCYIEERELHGGIPDWLKTSIRAEIVRLRLDRACSLLRQTNLGLAEIARQSGFRDGPSFCRLFQNRLRQTPTQYRHAKRSSI
jgi:hypothetical protein